MKDYKNSSKATSGGSIDVANEKQVALRDRHRRPDKLLYVPRALRAQKQNLDSENGSCNERSTSQNHLLLNSSKPIKIADKKYNQVNLFENSFKNSDKEADALKLPNKSFNSSNPSKKFTTEEFKPHDMKINIQKVKNAKTTQLFERTEQVANLGTKDILCDNNFRTTKSLSDNCLHETKLVSECIENANSSLEENALQNCNILFKSSQSVSIVDEKYTPFNSMENNFKSTHIKKGKLSCLSEKDNETLYSQLDTESEENISESDGKINKLYCHDLVGTPNTDPHSQDVEMNVTKDESLEYSSTLEIIEQTASFCNENMPCIENFTITKPLADNSLLEDKAVSKCIVFQTEKLDSCEEMSNNSPNGIQDEVTLSPVEGKILQTDESVEQIDSEINIFNTSSSSVSNFSDKGKYESKSKSSCLSKKQTKDVLCNHEESWEAKFNDEGDCLDPEFIKELTKVTGRIKVHVAKNSYDDFQPVSEAGFDEYDNIVEMFNFPVEFNTQDLVSCLSIFQQETFTIKWVDDCHALAVFTNPSLANQALQLNHQFVKFRPLSEGTKESKSKARYCARYAEPCKPRPTTSAALARRLVSGALGLKVNTTKEQRDRERNMLKEAKEKKRLKAKQRQDMWDGNVS